MRTKIEYYCLGFLEPNWRVYVNDIFIHNFWFEYSALEFILNIEDVDEIESIFVYINKIYTKNKVEIVSFAFRKNTLRVYRNLKAALALIEE